MIRNKSQARTIACRFRDMGTNRLSSTEMASTGIGHSDAIGESDRQVVQHRLGAAGQHKGPHHEHHQTRACRHILGPHDPISLSIGFVLLWFSIQNKNKPRSKILSAAPLYLTDVLFNLSVMENLDAAYAALADPTRRAILARLALGEATVGEIA